MIGKETHNQKSFRDQAEVIIRRRWFLVLPVVALTAAAVAAGMLLPKMYESSTVIRISNKRIIDPLVKDLAVTPDPSEQITMLSKQILSWQSLMRLVDQYGLVGDTADELELEDTILSLRKRITIEIKDKDIIKITYMDSDPVRAQKIANSITSNYIEENARIRKEEARDAIGFINDQLKIYRKKLEDSQKNFSTHKINAELRELTNRRKLLAARLEKLEKVIPSEVKVGQNPVVARLQNHLAELEMELSRLMLDATEEHPRVVELRSEIRRTKKSLDSEISRDTVSESISTSNPAYMQTEQELREVDMEIAFLERRKREMEAGGGAPGGSVTEEDLAALGTGKKVDEDIYQMLLRQMEAAYVSERLQESDTGASASVLEYARLPLRPARPDKIRILLIGLFLGLGVGVGLVYLVEYLDRSFRTTEEAKKVLKMPLMGSVSRIIVETRERPSVFTRMSGGFKKYLQKHKAFSELRIVSPHIARRLTTSGISPQVVIHHDPKSLVAEEFRIIRTNILGLDYESPMKTVMITSAVRAEGKSTTSTNLAVSMADSGKQVLLIDCDLRKGTVHELLNLPQAPGLADVLGKGVDVEAAVQTTKIRNLSVMTCGNRPHNPSELLGQDRMQKLLHSMRTRFDVVVMDAPPVLNLPDTGVLGKFVDGVFLVVRAERTQREDVQHAHSMLTQTHSSVAGFVMTNVQYYIPKYVYNYLYGT